MAEARVRALIYRETCKRVFWSLCREDWSASTWRNTYTFRPSQVTTPLPLNLHERDLAQGITAEQPAAAYTSLSWSLAQVKISHYVQRVFQAIDEPLERAHDVLLEVDADFSNWFASLPAWWTGGTLSSGMPPSYRWLQCAFTVSAHYKMLELHRRYVNKPEPRYETSRARIVDLARIILQEAPNVGECRIWTVLYHLSSACLLSLRDLFNQTHLPAAESAQRRSEIALAVSVLEGARPLSGIAQRAHHFISQLLQMEAEQAQQQQAASVVLDTQAAQPPPPLPQPFGPDFVFQEGGEMDPFQFDFLELDGRQHPLLWTEEGDGGMLFE
ncbi:hypothetical protein JCM6882_009168 [Rhodosporidiobolus microsporus]